MFGNAFFSDISLPTQQNLQATDFFFFSAFTHLQDATLRYKFTNVLLCKSRDFYLPSWLGSRRLYHEYHHRRRKVMKCENILRVFSFSFPFSFLPLTDNSRCISVSILQNGFNIVSRKCVSEIVRAISKNIKYPFLRCELFYAF